MKRPGVCRRKNTPSHFSRSRSASPIVSHPSRTNRWHVGFDVEAVLLALVALDLVERDRRLSRPTAAGASSARGRRGDTTVSKSSGRDRRLEALARQRDDRLHFRPARAAAGRRARDVAHRLHASRAVQHRFDDLRLRHVVAVADPRGIRDRRGELAAARHCRQRRKQQLGAVLVQRRSRRRTSAAATARRRRRQARWRRRADRCARSASCRCRATARCS